MPLVLVAHLGVEFKKHRVYSTSHPALALVLATRARASASAGTSGSTRASTSTSTSTSTSAMHGLCLLRWPCFCHIINLGVLILSDETCEPRLDLSGCSRTWWRLVFLGARPMRCRRFLHLSCKFVRDAKVLAKSVCKGFKFVDSHRENSFEVLIQAISTS